MIKLQDLISQSGHISKHNPARAFAPVNESPNEPINEATDLDKAYDILHDALVRASMAIKQHGDRKALSAFRKWWDELDRFYPQVDEGKKKKDEVASPLVNHLDHAIADVNYLRQAVSSEEAEDAFEDPKQSKKLLSAVEKLLKKVK